MNRLSRLTIRTKITGGSLLIAIAISLVAGILIYLQVERIVNDGQIEVLSNIEAPYLAALDEGSEFDEPGPAQSVAVVDPSGKTKIDTLPSSLDARLEGLLEHPGTRTVPTHHASYLVRVTPIAAQGGTWHVITAVNDDAQVSLLNQVTLLLVLSIAGINLAFGVASWLIGSAALAPVSRLRRSAADLVRRPGAELLPVGPAEDEIAELARTLNELIRQLRLSAERERQIVSDASHEFRTPLAIMTTQLELAQAEASTLPLMRKDVAAAQQTLTRLTTLATSMLELSRIDAQAQPGQATIGELTAELADAADRGRQRVGGRDIRIDYSSDVSADREASIVAVSVPDFGRACDNLVGNALAAMGESGVIDLTLGIAGDEARLLVRDDAGGMPADYVPHAFERFSRGDSSRGKTGAGLGLAIVEGIAALAGGSVRLDNRPGHGLTVEVRFGLVRD